jgi:plasmid rolling circle replication initiator protein Rep
MQNYTKETLNISKATCDKDKPKKKRPTPTVITPDDLEIQPELEDYQNKDVGDVLVKESLLEKKIQGRALAKKINSFNKSKAFKFGSCSEYVSESKTYSSGNQAIYMKSGYTGTCKNNLCPICNWRKVNKLGKETELLARKMIKDNPKLGFIFLTLTMKNPKLFNLRANIEDLNKAWQRLSQTKRFRGSFKGFVRSLEFPPQKNDKSRTHVHLHVMLIIDTSTYLKGQDYISQKDFTAMWKKALRADYTPMVDVRAVYKKGADGKKIPMRNLNSEERTEAVISAVKETIKYPAKPIDLIKMTDENLKTLMAQISNVRLISHGGLFKIYRRDFVTSSEILKEREEEIIKADTTRETYLEETFRYGRPKNELKGVYPTRKPTWDNPCLSTEIDKEKLTTLPNDYYLYYQKYSKRYKEDAEFREEIERLIEVKSRE